MRNRVGILVLLLASFLSACSDDGGSDDESSAPSDSPTEITIDCDEFEDTAAVITEAQTALYGGDPNALDTLLAELEALEEGAPEDVQTALADMADAFVRAEELLEDPTPEKQAELAELTPQLSEDSQTITAYITAQCE